MMQTLANAIARRCSTIWVLFLAGAIIVLASPQIAAAEETYPSRPIRLIVPFPPGGPTDVMGRLISQALSDQLRQQVYVDNRPGAGSTLAGKIAATAEPDGYTLLLGSAATDRADAISRRRIRSEALRAGVDGCRGALRHGRQP